jgi:hypothetical protein
MHIKHMLQATNLEVHRVQVDHSDALESGKWVRTLSFDMLGSAATVWPVQAAIFDAMIEGDVATVAPGDGSGSGEENEAKEGVSASKGVDGTARREEGNGAEACFDGVVSSAKSSVTQAADTAAAAAAAAAAGSDSGGILPEWASSREFVHFVDALSIAEATVDKQGKHQGRLVGPRQALASASKGISVAAIGPVPKANLHYSVILFLGDLGLSESKHLAGAWGLKIFPIPDCLLTKLGFMKSAFPSTLFNMKFFSVHCKRLLTIPLFYLIQLNNVALV